jgi:soluble lytic murein transglycosylase-like protein
LNVTRAGLTLVATLIAVAAPIGGRSAAYAQAAQAPIPKAVGALSAASKKRELQRATDKYDDTFRKYTKRYFGINFDWHPFKAQGMAESGLSPTAISWVGARGLMQLMPSTFAAIQSKRPEFTSIDDPEWNIAAGIMHDRYLWKLYEKDVPDEERFRFMFAGYNAGEGTINRARGVAVAKNLDKSQWTSIEQIAPEVQKWRYRETLDYVRKIEKNLTILKPAR